MFVEGCVPASSLQAQLPLSSRDLSPLPLRSQGSLHLSTCGYAFHSPSLASLSIRPKAMSRKAWALPPLSPNPPTHSFTPSLLIFSTAMTDPQNRSVKPFGTRRLPEHVFEGRGMRQVEWRGCFLWYPCESFRAAKAGLWKNSPLRQAEFTQHRLVTAVYFRVTRLVSARREGLTHSAGVRAQLKQPGQAGWWVSCPFRPSLPLANRCWLSKGPLGVRPVVLIQGTFGNVHRHF